MDRTVRIILLSVTLLAASASAQIETHGVRAPASGANFDFSTAQAIKPFKTGSSPPATCAVGEAFFNTAATAGNNLYLCTATNVWTQVFGTGQAAAPYVAALSGTIWSVTGATHGKGSTVEVFVQRDDTTDWILKDTPKLVKVNKSTGDITVEWSTAVTGRILITTLGGGSSGGTSDHAQLINLGYDQSGHTGFARENHGARHQVGGADPVAMQTPAANAIPASDGTGKLNRNWLPVFLGATGTQAGSVGAVPPPASGDDAKCLKGNATWGDCGSGGAGGDNVSIGGVAVTDPNFNNTTPAPPSGTQNVRWQQSGSPAQVSAYVQVMTGATGLSPGDSGLVPAPAAGQQGSCLKGDGTWGACSSGGGYQTVQDEGTALPQQPVLNFTGSSITCSNDAANSRTMCAVSTGGGGSFDPAALHDLSNSNRVNVEYLSITIANDPITGTITYRTACLTASGTAIQCTTAAAARTIGICVENCGIVGNARIAVSGKFACDFDGAVTSGNWVTVSGSSAGKCSDAGTSKPAAALGIAAQTGGVAGTYQVIKGAL